jgi:hypothetical protein
MAAFQTLLGLSEPDTHERRFSPLGSGFLANV